MISVIHAIKHDHTYVAKPGEKAIPKRVKISLEGFIKYIVFKKPSFNIETRRLQTVNWLVLSHNDNYTESSKTCQLINPVRILVEEGQSGINAYFQVLYKTKEMINLDRFEKIDRFLDLIDPQSGYKICSGCQPEDLCKPYPKVLEVCNL